MEEMEHLQNLMNDYFDQHDNLNDDDISMMSGMMSTERLIKLFEGREGRKIVWLATNMDEFVHDYAGKWVYA